MGFADMEKNEVEIPPELAEEYAELVRGIEEVIPETEFKEKLISSRKNGKPLKIKAGFDPTAPDLHLGHTVLIQKLRQFQKYGHEIYFLIGDYTAMIGDPTGKSETRKALSSEEVLENAKTYQKQVFKILDPEKTKIVFNSEWLKNLSLKNVIELTAKTTVARLLERDDFSKRYSSGVPISLVEFMYPLLQGYDSVALDADVELGGTDQKFNLLMGRNLQTAYGKKSQAIMTLPLLVGLDGVKKMSKSLGNYIGIQEDPMEVYGKLMSISDETMWTYMRLLSDKTIGEIKTLEENTKVAGLHPMEVKKEFALEITKRFSSPEKADSAKMEWEKIHNPQKRGLPEDIPLFIKNLADEKETGLLSVLSEAKAVTTNSEARRMVESGGVYLVDASGEKEERVGDPRMRLSAGEYIFRLGKRKFIRIKVV